MSDKTYHRLTIAIALALALALGATVTRNAPREKERKEGDEQFAPEVPPSVGRRDQRREVVHWTIREAQNRPPAASKLRDKWHRARTSWSPAMGSRESAERRPGAGAAFQGARVVTLDCENPSPYCDPFPSVQPCNLRPMLLLA